MDKERIQEWLYEIRYLCEKISEEEIVATKREGLNKIIIIIDFVSKDIQKKDSFGNDILLKFEEITVINKIIEELI